jgi:hypothetical protein
MGQHALATVGDRERELISVALADAVGRPDVRHREFDLAHRRRRMSRQHPTLVATLYEFRLSSAASA